MSNTKTSTIRSKVMTIKYFILFFSLILISCGGNDMVDDDQKTDMMDDENVDNNQIDINGTIWTLFNQNVFSTEVTTDGVKLNLDQNALWYQANQGGLLYQEITGDFSITATVKVRRKSNETMAPSCNICLGGLMARNPDNNNGENYVHLVTGNTPENVNDGTDEFGVEQKSTTNSVSPFAATADGLSDHELRIVRAGSGFSLYSRNIGTDQWTLVVTHSRPDLPSTLQVGLNIYTANSGTTADLSAIYENIVIDQ